MIPNVIDQEDVFNASSFSFLEKPVDFDLKDIVGHIEDILKSLFTNQYKQNVEVYSNRISFSCPYCGDSDDHRKKRGNIFYESMFFHCFRCGKHASAYNLIKHFKEDLSQSELIAIRSLQTMKNNFVYKDCDIFNNELIGKYIIPKAEVEKLFGFQSIKGSMGEAYLLKREQKDLSFFGYDPKMRGIVIYNLDKDNNVLGFIIRLLNSKSSNKYISYKLSTIYNKMDKPLPEDGEYLDKISLTFNILRLNYNDTIIVTEGPFDSFLLHNAVATGGLTKSLPITGENIKWFPDNDKQGRKKAIELLERGEFIFLWKKYLKAICIPDFIHIKDWNDLINYCKLKKIKVLPPEEYFSDSKLDLFFL